MTNREFLNTVINANISDEITAQAQDMLAKMDARNAKRAATPSKRSVENEPIKEKIVELLGNATELMTAPQVGEAIGVTTQKASALLRQMVEVGTLTSEEVKIPKKGKMKGYTLAEGAQYLDHEIAQ